MMSLRRYYHRRFGYHERFHLAVLRPIVAVPCGAVPTVAAFIEAVGGYAPTAYEPKDLARLEWLQRQVAPQMLGRISWEIVVDVLLLLLVAVVWLTFVPAPAPRAAAPPRGGGPPRAAPPPPPPPPALGPRRGGAGREPHRATRSAGARAR